MQAGTGSRHDKVNEIIEKELASLAEFGVYSEISSKEVKKGEKIIGSTLVLKQKGDIVKARICAQEFPNSKEVHQRRARLQ